jgi:hypothetical protein
MKDLLVLCGIGIAVVGVLAIALTFAPVIERMLAVIP